MEITTPIPKETKLILPPKKPLDDVFNTVFPSTFKTDFTPISLNYDIFEKKENNNIKKISPKQAPNNNIKKTTAIIGASLATIAAAFALTKKGKDVIQFIGCSNLRKLIKEKNIQYPNDAKYRLELLKSLKIKSSCDYKLASVMGQDEFIDVINKLSSDPEIYNPGKAIYDTTGKIIGFEQQNYEKFGFGANFHIHSRYSDGQMDIKTLLDDISSYADKRFEKTKQPFYFSLTDHDGIAGNIEILKELVKNPKKYQNVRFITGVEHSAVVEDSRYFSQKAHIHILNYGINPFEKNFYQMFEKRIQNNQNEVKKAIQNISSIYDKEIKKYNVKLSFNDMSLFIPKIENMLFNADYYTKDYLQFKFIYSYLVEKNSALLDELKKMHIDLSKLNYFTPIHSIPKNIQMKSNEKYYDYYIEALKNNILELIKTKKPNYTKDSLDKLMPKLNDSLKNLLQDVENKILDENSSSHIKKIEYLTLDDLISKTKQTQYGIIGFAHPGVIFPHCAVKDINSLCGFYDEIVSKTKHKMDSRPIFIEEHYQSYYNDEKTGIVSKIFEKTSSHTSLKTGGLDSHGPNFHE